MRFIFRVVRDLTEFAKVYLANLLISQYKRIIPARNLRNLYREMFCLSANLQNFIPRFFSAIRYVPVPVVYMHVLSCHIVFTWLYQLVVLSVHACTIT